MTNDCMLRSSVKELKSVIAKVRELFDGDAEKLIDAVLARADVALAGSEPCSDVRLMHKALSIARAEFERISYQKKADPKVLEVIDLALKKGERHG